MKVTDQRLADIHEGLVSGRYQTLSVDIFDTLLWRRVPEFPDAFLLLGHTLAAAGKLAAHVTPAAFADLRRTAERAARETVQAATGYREVKLIDICQALPDAAFAPGFTADERARMELACEQSLMVLDHDLAALMRAAKTANRRVILVSDTYFTSPELRGFLSTAGFTADGLVDKLYASNETGKPKYRDLFDVILKDLGEPAAKLVHIGDSEEADVTPCRLRGIGHVHYDKWAFAPRVQAVEFPADVARRAALLGREGDFGLTGLRSRLRHRAPAILADDLKPYWSYGAATLAPVFAAFARWIVAKCKTNGVKEIHGIMREGRFLGRLVAATAKDLGVDLTPKEIWLSRRAVLRAALYADDMGVLPEFIMVSPGRNTDEVLLQIGLTRGDLLGVLASNFDLKQPNALRLLCEAITTAPALKEKVLATSAKLRANLLRGLGKRWDLAKAQTITLMDLGYAATIQTVLARVLARENSPVKLAGLYLALNDRAVVHARGGAELHAYLHDGGFSGVTAALLSRTPDVLEHACMCREGSLAAYDDSGEPLLLPSQREDAQIAQMEAMQTGILAGVEAINALLGNLERTPADSLALKGQVAQVINAALLHPTPEEVATIGAWHHEANFDVTDIRRLTDLAFDPRELEYRGLPALMEVGRHQVYWPAAAFTAAIPYLGKAFAAGVDGAYGMDQLTSGPLLGSLVICPDAGAGFDMKRAGAVPLEINAFGRGHLQVTAKMFGADAWKRIRLTWPKGCAVIVLDQVAAAFIGERERKVTPAKIMAWSGTRIIAGGAQLQEEGGKSPETILELEPPPPWPHALELTVRFKYLRLDPLFGSQP